MLYATAEVGRPKVVAAAERLSQLNPEIEIIPHPVAIGADNARSLIGGYDLVLDGTDDFAARFVVADACVAEKKTLVSGAIGRWTGQIGVFAGQPCYRCLVPDAPPDAETCAAVGVIGGLAGVIGSMMAVEAVKLITGAGNALLGRLLIYDALAGETRTVRIGADPACPTCGSAA